MRGPSSSHCAAALRIGRLARDLMNGIIEEVRVTFDPRGSLVRTHESQGSDMGLFGGLLGWEATDRRLADSARAIQEAGIRVASSVAPFDAAHPNMYGIRLKNDRGIHALKALSAGGGAIEIVEIDGARVSIKGDYHEALVFVEHEADRVFAFLREQSNADHVLLNRVRGFRLIEIKSQSRMEDGIVSELRSRFGVREVRRLAPVLPVLSRRDLTVPFITCEAMMEYNREKGRALWELGLEYECVRGAMSRDKAFRMMRELVRLMQESIENGIRGTAYADRILGHQSGRFRVRMGQGRLLDAGILNTMILYVTALMEMKSAMGLIVAAPTAGACGGLPGACIGAADMLGLPVEHVIRSMFAAGIIGVLIAARATLAAEVGGCQAECGSASGMAAASLVTLAGGSLDQAVCAASIALQNTMGMVCDPVAGRVEVPCLGKNILAASNALASANMALADYDAVIPLDEVIETMDRVGRMLPGELRCTAMGGLSLTRTSKEIEERLNDPGSHR